MRRRDCKRCGVDITDMRTDALWCSDACRVAAAREREAVQNPNTPAGLTQTQRVLRALRARGEHGLTRVDFQPPHVLDGGAPILHPGARVEELRKKGYRILSAGRRNKCVIYVLVSEPSNSHELLPRVEPVAGPDGELHLFEHREPPRGAYDEDIAA